MEFDQLKLFTSVAATGSFSRTAVIHGTTQSAVSKRVLALEQELQCRLFERTGRGARLTEAGRLLLPRAEGLVRDAETLPETIGEAMRQPRGTVRIALQPSISWPLARAIHDRTAREFPGIRLQFLEGLMGQVEEWLREGRADIAVITRLNESGRSAENLLFGPELHLVSPPGDAITRPPTISFASLLHLPLIVPAMPNAGRVLVDEAARRVRGTLRVVLEVNAIHLIKRMVAEGRGYMVALRPAIADELAAGTLQASRIVRPVLRQPFYLSLANRERPSPAVEAVAAIVRQAGRSGLAPSSRPRP